MNSIDKTKLNLNNNTYTINNKDLNYLNYLKKQQSQEKKSINYRILNYISNNIRLTAFAIVELGNNIFLHFIDTIKVRNQAKNPINDTSMYHHNKITHKSKI